MASLGDWLAVTADERAFSVDAQGKGREQGRLESPVSEMRVWQVEGERQPRIGICLPEEDEVLWGKVIRAATWDRALKNAIGRHIGREQRSLFYPLSLDGSRDGRLYVLDAGNARIVVFDADGRYVTEWGRRGQEEGAFDFGEGGKMGMYRDWAGSVVVDEEGYIYVADVGNQRIQKFAS